MTDLKNIIEVSFPDDGVSVCVFVHIVYFSFFIFYFLFLFLFLFLVGVGRPPGGNKCTYKTRIVAEVSAKEGKQNIYIICIVQYVYIYIYIYICQSNSLTTIFSMHRLL